MLFRDAPWRAQVELPWIPALLFFWNRGPKVFSSMCVGAEMGWRDSKEEMSAAAFCVVLPPIIIFCGYSLFHEATKVQLLGIVPFSGKHLLATLLSPFIGFLFRSQIFALILLLIVIGGVLAFCGVFHFLVQGWQEVFRTGGNHVLK
ncbi:MAG: hypothetical protein K2X38_09745 [Gemmataceae bacterium]|nr:hypothetical protein [Gemmataceae bacterium]